MPLSFVNCERTVLFSVKRDLDPPFTTLLNDSVLQGSLNNHCRNTLDTSGVQINIKKNSLLVLSLVENLQKVKLKEFC